jgi:hypothetical protein
MFSAVLFTRSTILYDTYFNAKLSNDYGTESNLGSEFTMNFNNVYFSLIGTIYNNALCTSMNTAS